MHFAKSRSKMTKVRFIARIMSCLLQKTD